MLNYAGICSLIAGGVLYVSGLNQILSYENDIDEVAWWNTSDGGQNFEKGEVLLKRNKANFTDVISSMIRNAHPDARVIVAGEKRKGEFRNMYLLGDNGPVTRLKAEANQLDN